MLRGDVCPLVEAVDLIVHDNVGHIDIAADRMHRMAHANGKAVAVTAGGDDRQLAVGELDALRDWERATVNAMQPVGIDVTGDASRATDAGDDG